jgi:hypothetical protein
MIYMDMLDEMQSRQSCGCARLNYWQQVPARAATHANVAAGKPLVQVLHHEQGGYMLATAAAELVRGQPWPESGTNGHKPHVHLSASLRMTACTAMHVFRKSSACRASAAPQPTQCGSDNLLDYPLG